MCNNGWTGEKCDIMTCDNFYDCPYGGIYYLNLESCQILNNKRVFVKFSRLKEIFKNVIFFYHRSSKCHQEYFLVLVRSFFLIIMIFIVIFIL